MNRTPFLSGSEMEVDTKIIEPNRFATMMMHPRVGCINEITGRSADINQGFSGSFVWLIPRRTPKPTWLVDNLWTDIRSDADPGGTKDHAKGAGGDYRLFQVVQ
ncbi:hypothetical protein V8F33_003709 [Rhypophila sp. PSN 637]